MTRWRTVGRWMVIAAGWGIFAWSWLRVAGRTPADTFVWGAVAVTVITGVTVSLTTWWIVHNLRIYRRKGPRRAVPLAMPDYRSDFLGRSLQADWVLLRRSSVVVVRVDDEGKQFAAGVESPGWGLHP